MEQAQRKGLEVELRAMRSLEASGPVLPTDETWVLKIEFARRYVSEWGASAWDGERSLALQCGGDPIDVTIRTCRVGGREWWTAEPPALPDDLVQPARCGLTLSREAYGRIHTLRRTAVLRPSLRAVLEGPQ